MLTLVILAAGMGRRFGGPKQIEPLGPAGETLLEYSIFDARRAGFEQVVLVIQPQMEHLFRSFLLPRLPKEMPIFLAPQRSPDQNIAELRERLKPLGTGHALLAAAALLSGPFGVMNADDYYGPQALCLLADFLNQVSRDQVLITYELARTLSRNGPVARAICGVDPSGYLLRLDEQLEILTTLRGPARVDADQHQHLVPPDVPVSMNLWGFQPEFLPLLARCFEQFLMDRDRVFSAEFQLPTAVSQLIDQKQIRVRVIAGGEDWFGLTWPADKVSAQECLARKISMGQYPAPLWRES